MPVYLGMSATPSHVPLSTHVEGGVEYTLMVVEVGRGGGGGVCISKLKRLESVARTTDKGFSRNDIWHVVKAA